MAQRSLRAASAAPSIVLLLAASAGRRESPASQEKEAVGVKTASRTVVPVNQVVTPIGIQVSLPGLRPQALALSPDGKILAGAGKTHELVILDASTGEVRQRVVLPPEDQGTPQRQAPSPNVLQSDDEGQLSYTGLVFAPAGGSSAAVTCPTVFSSSTRKPGRSCGRSTSASRPSTSSSPAARPTSATGADAGLGRAT